MDLVSLELKRGCQYTAQFLDLNTIFGIYRRRNSCILAILRPLSIRFARWCRFSAERLKLSCTGLEDGTLGFGRSGRCATLAPRHQD